MKNLATLRPSSAANQNSTSVDGLIIFGFNAIFLFFIAQKLSGASSEACGYDRHCCDLHP
jgi:hypothetical protein